MSSARWTVKHNWNGELWGRTWRTKNEMLRDLEYETGLTSRQRKAEGFDWSYVRVRLVEVPGE